MTSRIAVLCAALAGVLVAVPTAEAKKPRPKPKPPLYELQLSGSEAVAWKYKVPGDGKCFHGAEGNGAQEVYYKTRKIKVRVIKSKVPGKKGLLQVVAQNDKLAQYGYEQGIPAVVQVDRDGEIKSSATCGGTDGRPPGGGSQQPPPKDCGLRWGRVQLHVGFHALTAFSVSGHYDNFAQPAPGEADDIIPPPFPPTEGQALGLVYENCDWILPPALAPTHDDLTVATKRLSVKRLPKKGKTLKISAGDRDEASDGERTGETSVAWNLKLKRIR